MSQGMNHCVILKSRPEGELQLDNFELSETPIPEPGGGEVLMRTLYLSVDPYMRGRMSARKSYANPVAIGGIMVGGTVGEVLKSRHPQYVAGGIVVRNDG